MKTDTAPHQGGSRGKFAARAARERAALGRVSRIMEMGLLAACMMVVAPMGQAASQTPAQALAFERAERMAPTRFYDTTVSLPAEKPGELIRSEAIAGYTVPKGMRAILILYHSRSVTGRDVAASGVVLLPPGHPPAGGWPVIAWAHGSSGMARICAPSMMKDVYYGNEGLFPMVRAGFAVVATDYAGLGTRGPSQYSWIGNANDVINSVEAAHQAVSLLSKRWVVDGHSQGGGAAWGVAEEESALKDPNYLGAVVVAGAVNVPWLVMRDWSGDAVSMYWLAYYVKARFPQFRVTDIVSKMDLGWYRALTEKGCWYYSEAVALSHVLGKSAVRPGWKKSTWVRKFLAENAVRYTRVRQPLLMLAGGADQSVPAGSIHEVVVAACRRGYPIDYRVYPGLDHDQLMSDSTPDQLRWIRARFARKPAPVKCAQLRDPQPLSIASRR